MKRRIICTLLSILLVLSAIPASSAASISESKPLLSEMSESECIAFVKGYGIELPTIYDEAEWGPFVKAAITLFENNPNAPITVSYTVTAKLEKEIRHAVHDYYGITSTDTGQPRLNAYTTSSSGLQYSTVYAEWDSQFEKYNCYSYALGITSAWFDPGLITAMSENPSCIESWDLDIENITIEQIRDAVIEDLGTLGETRIIYEESAMDTNNLCTNESVICVRKGNRDYHFMRYTAAGWLHKPSNTQILKYNSVPTDGVVWTNEAVYMGSYYEATIEYDSTIYFISYNGHDWNYTNNGDGTHTKSCIICGDIFTSNCEYNYTYIGDDMHNASCKYCSNGYAGAFCSFTSTYNGDGTHTRSCNSCSNAYTASCNLEYTNLTNTRHSVSCTVCDYEINSQLCTLTYTSNENQTHTVRCTLCGNSRINNCSLVTNSADDNQHFTGCNKCDYGYYSDCVAVYVYCGSDTLGDVHEIVCQTCDNSMGSGTEPCDLAYQYNGQVNGSNTHVHACTDCGHVDSGPTACTYIGTKPCLLCGSLKDQVSVNDAEEDVTQG